MRRIFQIGTVALAWALSAGAAVAQTTTSLAWDYDVPPSDVATYTQLVAIDGALVPGTPTCGPRAGTTTQTTCQVPIPPLASGAHVVSVTAQRNGMTAETRLSGVNPTTGPHNPSSPRVTVTVTVTVP